MPTPVSTRIGISINSEIEPGTIISLNLPRATFIEVDGLCLTKKVPTAVIPGSIGTKALADLKHALDDNMIVIGSEPVPIALDNELEQKINKLCDFLHDPLSPEETTKALGRSCSSMSGPRKRVHLPHLLERMLAIEEAGYKRDFVLSKIHALMDRIEGPTKVREETLEEVKIPDRLVKLQQAALQPIASNPDI